MSNGKTKQTDHDTLIVLVGAVANLDKKLDDKFREVKSDIREIKDGTTSRIESLESEKADKKDVEKLQGIVNDDIEVRVRKLESKTANYLITLTLYSVAVGTMIALIIYHILQK